MVDMCARPELRLYGVYMLTLLVYYSVICKARVSGVYLASEGASGVKPSIG